MDTIRCPRCGTENPAQALNCQVCRINLEFALENPAEFESIRPEIPFPDPGAAAASSSQPPIWKPVLLILGSFTFAFLLAEAVHEAGHYLAHRAYGYQVGFILDPFGGSRTLGSSSPQEIWGLTTAAGPLLNLALGSVMLVILWSRRKPEILPLLLWGPVAYVQEGVNFSLGMLSPGSDADLLTRWGIPAVVLVALGLLLLAAGVVFISALLPLTGISPEDTFGRKFSVVSGGMVSFMILRLLGSAFQSPAMAQENSLPLIFSLILAGVVAATVRMVDNRLGRPTQSTNSKPGWGPVMASLVLATCVILFQLAAFN